MDFCQLILEVEQFVEQTCLLDDKKFRFAKMTLIGRDKHYWYDIDNLRFGRDKPTMAE